MELLVTSQRIGPTFSNALLGTEKFGKGMDSTDQTSKNEDYKFRRGIIDFFS